MKTYNIIFVAFLMCGCSFGYGMNFDINEFNERITEHRSIRKMYTELKGCLKEIKQIPNKKKLLEEMSLRKYNEVCAELGFFLVSVEERIKEIDDLCARIMSFVTERDCPVNTDSYLKKALEEYYLPKRRN